MKSYFKFGVVLFIIAFSLSAFAGSVSNYSYSTNLSGVSNTTVNAQFTYNAATGTFTSESLSFVGNSIFGGLSGTNTVPQSGDTFVFKGTVDGYTVSYTIVLNPLNGTFDAYGTISQGGNNGSFQYDTMAPEGGTQLSYLAASGLVLFAGILLADERRRRLAEN